MEQQKVVKGNAKKHYVKKEHVEATPKKLIPMQDGELTGTIKWFDVTRGYGFVQLEDGSETFVHFSDIESGRNFIGFNNEDKVTFQMKEGKNGPQASRVRLQEND